MEFLNYDKNDVNFGKTRVIASYTFRLICSIIDIFHEFFDYRIHELLGNVVRLSISYYSINNLLFEAVHYNKMKLYY